MLLRHPSKPDAQGHQQRISRTQRKWLPIPLAVIKRVLLVFVENAWGDVFKNADATFTAPTKKESDVHEPATNRVIRVAFDSQPGQVLIQQLLQRRVFFLRLLGRESHIEPPGSPTFLTVFFAG